MTEQPTTDQQSADVAQDLVERVWAERLRGWIAWNQRTPTGVSA